MQLRCDDEREWGGAGNGGNIDFNCLTQIRVF